MFPKGSKTPDASQASQEAANQGAANEQPAAESAQTPPYITRNELQNLGLVTRSDLESFGKTLLQRAGQSATDKIRAGLAAYGQAVELQKQLGTPIPDDQQVRARQKIIEDGLAGAEGTATAPHPQSATAPASAPSADEDSWPTYVLGQVKRTFQSVGVDVQPGDPEWTTLEQVLGDPNKEFADVIQAAAVAATTKKARQASDASTAQNRVGGGGGGPVAPGDITQITDTDTLYRMGEQEMRQARQR